MDWLNKARQFVSGLIGGAGKTISNIAGGVARGVGQAEQQASQIARRAVSQAQRQVPRFQAPQMPRIQFPTFTPPRIQAPHVQLPQAPKIDLAAIGRALQGFQQGIDISGRTFTGKALTPEQQRLVAQIPNGRTMLAVTPRASEIGQFLRSTAPGIDLGLSIKEKGLSAFGPQAIMQRGPVAGISQLVQKTSERVAATPEAARLRQMPGITGELAKYQQLQAIKPSEAIKQPIVASLKTVENLPIIKDIGDTQAGKFVKENFAKPLLNDFITVAQRTGGAQMGEKTYAEGIKGYSQVIKDMLTVATAAWTGGLSVKLGTKGVAFLPTAAKLAPRLFASGTAQDIIGQLSEGKKPDQIDWTRALSAGTTYTTLGIGLPGVSRGVGAGFNKLLSKGQSTIATKVAQALPTDKNALVIAGSLPEKGALRAQGYTNIKVEFKPKPGQVAPAMQGGAIYENVPKSYLQPKGEVPKVAETPKSSVQTVIDALAEAKPIRGKQERLYSIERGKRIAKVAAMGEKVPGEKGYFAQLGQLKGELPKVQFEGIRKQITQPVVDDLFNQVEKSTISPFEKVTAKTGLAKLLGAEGGSVPTRGELSLLNEVFPKELTQAILAKRTVMQKLGSIGGEIINLPRSIQASVDLSGPLRQGALLIGRPKQWIPAFASMFKYAGSEKAYQGLMENIRMRPTYQAMRQSKLALTDMSNPLQGREEAFMSNLAERIPIIGRVIKGSDRAYTGFINKLRADTFDDLLSKAKQTGAFDNNPNIADDIAKFVNTATGRGNLPGSVERAAVVLNGAFFSPRLMASRIQTLNPMYYVKLDPFVRKEALKSLLTFAGTAASIVGMTKLAGADVGIDPRSADFGKIKIGDTRYDPWAGFQQYIVLGSRLLTGQMISSTTGKEIRLGEGYKTPNRLDIITRFLQSKESPIASFVTGLLQQQTATGEKFNIPAEVVDRFIPMMANDLYDLYREYGTKGLAMGIPGLFGAGSQTYTDQIPMKGKTATGKENIQWRQAPSLGETIVNKVTGTQISNIPKEQWASLQEKKKVETQWGIDLAGIKAKVLTTGESQTVKNPVNGKDVQIYLKNGIVTTKDVSPKQIKMKSAKLPKGKKTGGRKVSGAKAKRISLKTPRLKPIRVSAPKARKVSFKVATPTKARKSIKIKTG